MFFFHYDVKSLGTLISRPETAEGIVSSMFIFNFHQDLEQLYTATAQGCLFIAQITVACAEILETEFGDAGVSIMIIFLSSRR